MLNGSPEERFAVARQQPRPSNASRIFALLLVCVNALLSVSIPDRAEDVMHPQSRGVLAALTPDRAERVL